MYLFDQFFFFSITFTFVISLYNILFNRHNIIIILLCFEILYLCSTLIFAFISYKTGLLFGLVFIMYIITTAGAEACIGLAIISIYYSGTKELSLNTLTILKL